MLPVVWLVGTSGVGKSTVGWQVRADLAAAGVAAAFVDSDQLRLAVGLGGAFETELIARSLRALEPGYRDAGAALLVVAGLADDPAHLSELLPGVRRADILVCHLHADDAAIRDRILRRGWQVHLAGSAVEYATRIDRGWADLRIDTSTLSPGDVAATVSRAALAHLRRVPRDASRDAAEGTDGRCADGVSARVLLLAGPGGVGTSTIGFEVYRQLAKSGRRVGYLDLHQLGFVGADPRGDQLALLRSRNARAAAATLAGTGIDTIVITADLVTAKVVLDTPQWRDTDVMAFELHADPSTIAERIRLRAQGHAPPIAGDHRRGLSGSALDESINTSLTEASQRRFRIAGANRVSADAAEPATTATSIISTAGLSRC
ncbi:adenylyl-sulfate kinase [Mycolicibacterium sp.]|uniref:adenylyl-sulfate kinase n=1 Tax=Mycolicibacterium sp. TaxID=2320850 RepID=UPI00093C608B